MSDMKEDVKEGTSEDKGKLSRKDALELYENGKHRRYTLLFSVNGGAFAVAQLIKEGKSIGGLSHQTLAIGMTFFTIVMIWDIFMFGERSKKEPNSTDVFGKPGQRVLLSICILICLGWLLVGFGKYLPSVFPAACQ